LCSRWDGSRGSSKVLVKVRAGGASCVRAATVAALTNNRRAIRNLLPNNAGLQECPRPAIAQGSITRLPVGSVFAGRRPARPSASVRLLHVQKRKQKHGRGGRRVRQGRPPPGGAQSLHPKSANTPRSGGADMCWPFALARLFCLGSASYLRSCWPRAAACSRGIQPGPRSPRVVRDDRTSKRTIVWGPVIASLLPGKFRTTSWLTMPMIRTGCDHCSRSR